MRVTYISRIDGIFTDIITGEMSYTSELAIKNIYFLFVIDNGLSFISEWGCTYILTYLAFNEHKESFWVCFNIRGYTITNVLIICCHADFPRCFDPCFKVTPIPLKLRSFRWIIGSLFHSNNPRLRVTGKHKLVHLCGSSVFLHELINFRLNLFFHLLHVNFIP